MKAPALLRNKYVLYGLLFLGIINILGYVALEDYSSLALFVTIGLLSTYFSKNMAVNLLSAIAVTSLVAINNKVREGFTEGATTGHNPDDSKAAADAASAIDSATDVADQAQKAVKQLSKKSKCKEDSDCPEGKSCNEGECVKATKSGFQNNVPPSSPAAIDDDESPGDRIDYAATLELAYDNLNKMLGEGGMKSITSETKKLVAQQKDLMQTLNSMAPVLNTAKETLAGMDLPNMGQLGNILGKLNGSNASAPSLKKK